MKRSAVFHETPRSNLAHTVPLEVGEGAKLALDVTWYLVIGLAILFALDLVAGLSGSSAGRLDLVVRFELDPADYQIVAEPLGVERALIRETRGRVVFGNSSWSLLLPYLGQVIVVLGASLTIIYQLRRVFETPVAG